MGRLYSTCSWSGGYKITVLFYTAVHLLRALMNERDIEVGDSHHALRNAINPNNPNSTTSVRPHCYSSYLTLYNASLEVRYSGFIHPEQRIKYLKKSLINARPHFSLLMPT